MVTITDSRVRNTIFETVYDLINSGKSGYNASSTPTLYGGHPDLSTITFPAIIINPVSVSEDSFTVDTSRSTSSKLIVVVIEVYAKSNKDVDNITDGIFNTLRTNPFAGAFLNEMNDDYSMIEPNDGKLKAKNITVTYMRR